MNINEPIKYDISLLEKKYGGYTRDVPIKKNSPLDPNIKNLNGLFYTGRNNNITTSQCGGDRMSSSYMGYGEVYEKILENLHETKNVVEIGILTGIGIAIWSDIFKNAIINGLDIDLRNFLDNRNNLINKGAFKNNNVNVYEFDQYAPNINLLCNLTSKNKFDFVIDDGCHQDTAIITTFTKIYPFFSDKFIYVIEDNYEAYKSLLAKFHNIKATNIEQITVITNKNNNNIHNSLKYINKLNSTKHALYFTENKQIVSHSTNNSYGNTLLLKYKVGDIIKLNKDKTTLKFKIVNKTVSKGKVVLYFSNKLSKDLIENRRNWVIIK